MGWSWQSWVLSCSSLQGRLFGGSGVFVFQKQRCMVREFRLKGACASAIEEAFSNVFSTSA